MHGPIVCLCAQSYSQIVIALGYKWHTAHACLVHSLGLPGSLIVWHMERSGGYTGVGLSVIPGDTR